MSVTGTAGAPRLTPRVREIVATALALLEEQGAEALTMRGLAERLGIRAPSLYKHLASKADLETAVIAVGFEDLAATLEAAASEGVSGADGVIGPGRTAGFGDANGPGVTDGPGATDGIGGPGAAGGLERLGAAYREFAVARPHLYRLMNERALDRERLPAGLEDRAAAPLVAAVGGDADLARAAWAFAHGMVMLELNERFPPEADVAAAWRAGLARFSGGVTEWAAG